MKKKIIFALYIIIILILAASTIIEHYTSTNFVSFNIYGSSWFSLLWLILVLFSIPITCKFIRRNKSTFIIHLSLIIILAGAFVTHLTATQGTISLREGKVTDAYLEQIDQDNKIYHTLPFSIKLNKFSISYHPGTKAASDYSSQLTITDNGKEITTEISMNKIFDYSGYRFYQSGYDPDGLGTLISIKKDSLGTPITYTGYLLLFLSLIWLLINPDGTFRKLLKNPLLKQCCILSFFICSCQTISASPTFPEKLAKDFGNLYILHNERICPLQTYAKDFTKKLYGKDNYKGLSAEQVVTGFIFWGKDWSDEKILKVKSGKFKDEFNLEDYVSLNDLFSMGGYRLKAPIEEYYRGNQDRYHKDAQELDEKVNLIIELQNGSPLKIFPHNNHGNIEWYAPNQHYPATVSSNENQLWQKFFIDLYRDSQTSDYTNSEEIISNILSYQKRVGQNSLPSDTSFQAERLYNYFPVTKILSIFNLSIGLITFILLICQMTKRATQKLTKTSIWNKVAFCLFIISFLSLSYILGLRWLISGNIPLSNGYETMLSVAWLTQLLAIICYKKTKIVIVFGYLLAGFFLLVSNISQMDPSIGPIMPVLNSPLLSIHVSIIMMSYALLSMTFICGLTALIIKIISHHNSTNVNVKIEALQILSKVFLYPAITTLGLGIFIGAIWANISWGTYWSWDPKETWALITFMIYAVGLHTKSITALEKPLRFHIFTTLSFLTIIITYFGVNYVLGGMHSYA